MDATIVLSIFFVGLMGAALGCAFGCTSGMHKGYENGIYMNRYLFDHMREVDSAHKKERDLYREVAIGLCDKLDDCMYCPFETDKCNERCKLWETERRRGLA